MSLFSSPAVVLRRRDFGDFDLILTLYARSEGKITVIAKSAKKSTRRFPGVLELFSVIHAVLRKGRRGAMPVLQEASLLKAHPIIRTDFKKTAYASYWAEIVDEWSEEGSAQPEMYHLLDHVLKGLDQGWAMDESLSLLFQIRFLRLSGMHPNLTHCRVCKAALEDLPGARVYFDLAKGAPVCHKCRSSRVKPYLLPKGLLKQLQWMAEADLDAARRIRWTGDALETASLFVEAFISHHVGKRFRSLKVLKQLCR